MPKTMLHQLAQSGATDGQLATWDGGAGDGGEWIPTDPSAGGAPLGWFNVKDYGAVGDNSADDTAAINLAIAALNAAGRGTLYFPSGYYKTTADLTTITARCVIVGEGSADASGITGGSLIFRTATTGVPLTISQHGCTVTRIGFVNPTSTTQTAGSAIRVTAGDRGKLDDVSVYGFYDCINNEDGGEWQATGLWLVGPVRYALYARHIDSPDGGDMSISKSWFYAKDRNASAAIRWESGGGMRLSDVKFNDYAGTGKFAVGLDASFGSGVNTAVLTVGGCSFENVSGPFIKGRVSGSGSFTEAIISGNQFAYYTGVTSAAIDIDGWSDLEIGPNNGVAKFGGSTQPFAKIANAVNVTIGLNGYNGFTSEYSLTSCSGIVSAGVVPATRAVATGTGLTGGGDLSADRTLAIDTSAEAERVQDLVGAMFTDGTNITHVYDDAAGTLTVNASGSGGLRLAPMTTTIGGGDPQLVFTPAGELLMMEIPS